MEKRFNGNFTQQEPIPEEGIDAALAVLRSGRLHRYNTVDGEVGETALLEQEFAEMVGAKYCLAVASGGYAIATALRAVGVLSGDTVLSNAFTLAPVPGAIFSVGAVPIYVGVTRDLTIDLDDLKSKLPQARFLLLSHMRGHICDMDRLMDMCREASVTVIEDCAHTMGASFRSVPSGRHGAVACYSTQTYKHANSGEGGLLVSDDPEIAARAVLMSGSYMMHGRHIAAPPPEVFERLKYVTPNISGRMDNLRAAILRPQLRDLPERIERWNVLYHAMEHALANAPQVVVPKRPQDEAYVGSSFQFLLPDFSSDAISGFIKRCENRGVELKWFGEPEPKGFTSRYDSWQFTSIERMPETDDVLRGLIDMRLPLTFSKRDCELIAEIICQELNAR